MDFFGIEQDQAEQDIQHRKTRNLSSEENVIDQQYFGSLDDAQHSAMSSDTIETPTASLIDAELEEIDQQYFGRTSKGDSAHPEAFYSHSLSTASDLHDSENYIDQKYFGSPQEHEASATKTVRSNPPREQTTTIKQKTSPRSSKENVSKQIQDDNPVRISEMVRDVREKARINLYTGSNLELPTTASSKAHQKHPIEGKSQRTPRIRDVINFNHLTEDEAASILAKSILEVRENIIVLNKPYGICTQPGPGLKYSITELLPRLEHRVRKLEGRLESADTNVGEFFLAHRLDRECTGVMLVARNRDACLRLQEAFSRHWFEKRYLCITSGIPETVKGAIQLPLIEKKFNGIYKMCVSPLNRRVQTERCAALRSDLSATTENEQDLELHLDASAFPTTHYEMLDRHNGAALLTCTSTHGLKHQIRVHLSMGLHTPILGDHKYSHVKYLAPQRLSHRLLEQINIRQSKVRHLPLYLHASHIQLSQHGQVAGSKLDFMTVKSKNEQSFSAPVQFFAPPPTHFLEMLRQIGMKLPRHLSKLA